MTSYEEATDENTPLTVDEEGSARVKKKVVDRSQESSPRDSFSCSGTSLNPKWVVELEGVESRGELEGREEDEDEDEGGRFEDRALVVNALELERRFLAVGVRSIF